MSDWRVAVTTTANASSEIGLQLADRGLDPVFLPCLEVVTAPPSELEGIRQAAAAADWILLTSGRAVEVVWPNGAMPPARVAAVGPATAEAARRAGGNVALVGDAGAHRLLTQLAEVIDGGTLVFPHAANTEAATELALDTLGVHVIARSVYHTSPVPPSADPVDAAMFASPSAVAGWSMSRDMEGLVIAAIGRTTLGAIEAAGHRADVVAKRPGFPEMISALADHLAGPNRRSRS